MLVGGQQTPAIRVQVDPAKLASMGMTMEDVRTVLTNATVDNPKGSIDGPQQSYTIYANDQLTKAEPYNNIIIGYRNGAAIRIGDIGHAVDGPQNRPVERHGPTANARSCCWCSSRPTPTSSRPPTA